MSWYKLDRVNAEKIERADSERASKTQKDKKKKKEYVLRCIIWFLFLWMAGRAQNIP
jgi:hypothetical protein